MSTDHDDRLNRVWDIPVRGDTPPVADAELVRRLHGVSAATACARMNSQGVRRTWIDGPVALNRGQKVVGRAVTLQFMPQREDIADGVTQEYIERSTALWAVLDEIQPGDVLVVEARGSHTTGCFGDMLVRYFKNRGGAALLVDGRIRDVPRVRQLDVPVWCTGATPHYASQTEMFPWAYNVPVAVGGVLTLPGDYVVADDDGAVVVPRGRAERLLADAAAHEEWEVFSRMRIDQGAPLRDYYPLTEATRREYELWRANGAGIEAR
ncbi:ribonuclease activity regulator RraA [Amycolatopsis vastitatis]|uniref:Putative 4-hydroxy-4-methyl-2-oxoglutarate aldolase n=1 Tax=Amycolatopsis vastitatis TaxID=1905142 RepID=A0A229SLV8_9PSEU|nr:ribonuclease activity regulator RraA [Amycolatopsis vastitatis]OXM59987.1 ribonuclease activity regulator RraA [Amycolatopsis vastitatis]